MAKAMLDPSVDSVGDNYDNVVGEPINGLDKVEPEANYYATIENLDMIA